MRHGSVRTGGWLVLQITHIVAEEKEETDIMADYLQTATTRNEEKMVQR